MKLKLIDPALAGGGARIVPALAGTGVSTEVEYGHEVEVPDALAGKEPRVDENGNVTDMGAGLLAQSDIWARADAPREKKD